MVRARLTAASRGPSKTAAMLAYPRLGPLRPMPRWNMLLRSLLVVLSICFFPVAAVAQQPGEAPQAVDGPLTTHKAAAMNNDSVMKMAKAGLGDELIVETINTQ